MDAAATAEHRALAGDIRRACPAGTQQPLGKPGIEAPGDRILARAPPGREEGTHTERPLRARRVGPGEAELEVTIARFDREHSLCAIHQYRDPARAVVRPLGV